MWGTWSFECDRLAETPGMWTFINPAMIFTIELRKKPNLGNGPSSSPPNNIGLSIYVIYTCNYKIKLECKTIPFQKKQFFNDLKVN